MDQFSYFMIRIRRSPAEDRLQPLPLEGMVERLGAGEKRSFGDGEELLRLLSGWAEAFPNLGLDVGADKGFGTAGAQQ